MLPVIELLQLTLTIFRRNAGLYIGYSAWLLIPAAAIYATTALLPDQSFWITIIGQIALIILGIWIWIMLTLITAKIIGREKINTEHLSREARLRIWPVAVVGLIVGVVELVGFLLFIIPGIILMVWYAFAQIDVVLSDRRGLAALAASREITRNRFWSVLWRLVGGPLLVGVGYLIISTAAISLVEWLATGNVTIFTTTPSLTASLLGLITDTLIIPVFVIYLTLVYLDFKQTLKGAKEHYET